MADPTILIGAVAYDPKVVILWEGLREHFHEHGVALDFALFSAYERLIDALLQGHVDIAWSSPIAHVRVKRRTEGKALGIAMRDRDRDACAKILVRRDAGLRKLTDLHGKVMAVGTRDSAQTRILPLYYLKQAGVDLAQVKIHAFDGDMGKHGDTGASELEVLAALHSGRAQAGAIGSLVWQAEQAAGNVDPRVIDVLWTTPSFDLRIFDATPSLPAEKIEAFRRALSELNHANPKHRKMLDLEGTRRFLPGREQSYAPVRAAMEEIGDRLLETR